MIVLAQCRHGLKIHTDGNPLAKIYDTGRMLLKRPGFTLTVVMTLALGIGANATIFTWIKAILLAPLPGMERPDEAGRIWGATRHNSALSTSISIILDFRDRNTACRV